MFLSKCAGIYYLFFNDDSGRRRKVLTRLRHKPEAIEFLRAFSREDHARRVRLKRISLLEFSKAYFEYSQGTHRPATRRCAGIALREFLKFLGDMPLNRVGVREVEHFLVVKRKEASEVTARTYYATLASAFETARRWGYLASNPFRAVRPPKLPEIQPPYFSKTDFISLMKCIDDADFRDLVMCAISTGMRLGELRMLQWEDVDFVRRTILVQSRGEFETKSKKNRTIPMNETLARILESRKETLTCETPFVFHHQGWPISENVVTKTFKKCIRTAKLDERLHFHSMRHTFASWLASDDVSLFAIQKLLGHSSSAVTQIYAHLQPEQLHSVVDRIAVGVN